MTSVFIPLRNREKMNTQIVCFTLLWMVGEEKDESPMCCSNSSFMLHHNSQSSHRCFLFLLKNENWAFSVLHPAKIMM